MKTNKNISFIVQKLSNHAFGYKYNVKVYINNVYAGYGKYCKTLREVALFKNKVKLEYSK